MSEVRALRCDGPGCQAIMKANPIGKWDKAPETAVSAFEVYVDPYHGHSPDRTFHFHSAQCLAEWAAARFGAQVFTDTRLNVLRSRRDAGMNVPPIIEPTSPQG